MIPENFELALVIGEYSYYVNSNESDEEPILIKNGEVRSDNFLAANSLMEDLNKIYLGEIRDYEMSSDMKYNFQEMIKAGYFEY